MLIMNFYSWNGFPITLRTRSIYWITSSPPKKNKDTTGFCYCTWETLFLWRNTTAFIEFDRRKKEYNAYVYQNDFRLKSLYVIYIHLNSSFNENLNYLYVQSRDNYNTKRGIQSKVFYRKKHFSLFNNYIYYYQINLPINILD